MGPLSTYTYTRTTTLPPPVTSFDSHPCQQSFSVSSFPAATEMEKATLLRGLICLPVCFSLFAFIFIVYDCPLLLPKLPKETGIGLGEAGGGRSVRTRQRGALLKENEENWKWPVLWRRQDEESQSDCEGRRVGERERRKWKRKREEILLNPFRLWRREIKSNSVKYCVKYDFDRIILTQGTISNMLGLPGCLCRQKPQGGAVTEGALTVKLLSPAALLVKQCALQSTSCFLTEVEP